VIGWTPVAVRAAAYVERARASMSGVAGSDVDVTALPRPFDDTAVQREVAREIQVHGWPAGRGTRFIVLTGSAPVSAKRYCAYDSAFYLGGNLAMPVVYGVVPAGTTEECGIIDPVIDRLRTRMDIDPFVRTP